MSQKPPLGKVPQFPQVIIAFTSPAYHPVHWQWSKCQTSVSAPIDQYFKHLTSMNA